MNFPIRTPHLHPHIKPEEEWISQVILSIQFTVFVSDSTWERSALIFGNGTKLLKVPDAAVPTGYFWLLFLFYLLYCLHFFFFVLVTDCQVSSRANSSWLTWVIRFFEDPVSYDRKLQGYNDC